MLVPVLLRKKPDTALTIFSFCGSPRSIREPATTAHMTFIEAMVKVFSKRMLPSTDDLIAACVGLFKDLTTADHEI